MVPAQPLVDVFLATEEEAMGTRLGQKTKGAVAGKFELRRRTKLKI